MEIALKVQRHIVVGYAAADSGEWVFTICRRGMQACLGQRLKTGATYKVNFQATEIERLDEPEVPTNETPTGQRDAAKRGPEQPSVAQEHLK